MAKKVTLLLLLLAVIKRHLNQYSLQVCTDLQQVPAVHSTLQNFSMTFKKTVVTVNLHDFGKLNIEYFFNSLGGPE